MSGSGAVSVLLIEDNDIDAEAIRRAFERLRINSPLVVATDGEMALDILRGENGHQQIEWPYIVLLDLNLPRMDGFEFLESIRNEPTLAGTIVFVLTTSDRELDKQRAYQFQVAGYIVKTKIEDGFLELATMIDSFWRMSEFPPR